MGLALLYGKLSFKTGKIVPLEPYQTTAEQLQNTLRISITMERKFRFYALIEVTNLLTPGNFNVKLVQYGVKDSGKSIVEVSRTLITANTLEHIARKERVPVWNLSLSALQRKM
jgi:hypothetical protein